ncbi:helix-turn-helix transcriptional regulator [Pseudomonas sp. NPDC098747]|uniref:helix-turn-helix transcriptional regulator n=1 Tax=Pseudomonas sp. NPDC098747 TaxID=3364487 RepID=UPI00383A668D
MPIKKRNPEQSVFPVPSPYATAAQLCAQYQISRATWWRWSNTDNFPKPYRFGRTVRWDVAAVEAYLQRREA